MISNPISCFPYPCFLFTFRQPAAHQLSRRNSRLFHFIDFITLQCTRHLGLISYLITFCVSRRRRKMYCGHARLCVCLSAAVRPHYTTDPDVTWGRGCPLVVVHYWSDLQLGQKLCCCGNITRTLVTSLSKLSPSRDMTT